MTKCDKHQQYHRLINFLKHYTHRQLKAIYKDTVYHLGLYVTPAKFGRNATVKLCRKRTWLIRRERAIMHIFTFSAKRVAP